MLTKVVRKSVSPAAVKAMLLDGQELALVDVREELIYSQSHLLWARCIPLSRLELRFAALVPRKGTRIVLVDDNDGLAERAAAVLTRHGYDDVSILEGGNAGWEAAGNELFSGVYVPSKAFGEFIEHDRDTPNISADELAALIRNRADMVILDSRPLDEFSRVSIPTATNVPGAELVLRARDMAPSPDTLVVVNCAGRTRSIIGAQSLINAGLPNKVVALRNGTMGFTLAGHTCDCGKSRQASLPSPDTLAWAQSAAAAVGERHGVTHIDAETLARFRAEAEQRTLYLFDVRDPAEYAAGHVAGAVSAPGGQLVQATDQYVGTLGARIVLIDDLDGARRHDGVLAAADGFPGCLRAGRDRQRTRAAARARARSRAGRRPAHRHRAACGDAGARRRDRGRPVAKPGLSQGPHSRRLVCDPRRSPRRAREDRRDRNAGAHVGGRHAGRHRGERSRRCFRRSGALPRRRQRGLGGGRTTAIDRTAHGR